MKSVGHILPLLLVVLMSHRTMCQDTTLFPTASYSFIDEYEKCYYSQITGVESQFICNTNLYGSIEDWLGTPYRYSGTTRNGVDCSAFVRAVFLEAFEHSFDGNSVAYFKASTPVRKDHLQEGDLVFFRINRNKTISHVGVFLGNDKFAHASRSRGVVISDLNSPYYKKHFVRGGRMTLTTQE